MRAVVLTGVSRGLGAALFDELLRLDVRIMGLSRHFTPAQRELARAAPDRIELRPTDLAFPSRLPEADELGRFLAGASGGVLIHNAGTVDPIGEVGALAPAALTTALHVNLLAPILLTNAFLAAAGDGLPVRVLFVSSGAAKQPTAGWAAYGAAKAGGEMFFETLATEDRSRYVASLHPGKMDTGMQETIRAADFDGRDTFVRAYAEGDLADPRTVARRLIEDHLG